MIFALTRIHNKPDVPITDCNTFAAVLLICHIRAVDDMSGTACEICAGELRSMKKLMIMAAMLAGSKQGANWITGINPAAVQAVNDGE